MRLKPVSDRHLAKPLRTADALLELMDPTVAQQFNSQQRHEIRRLLNLAIGKPSSKIVDLRFTIDLLISRFYFTLFVGEDRRNQGRRNNSGSRIGNFIAAIGLILTLNILLTTSVFIVAYLLKSALGINLFPGHFRDILTVLK